MKKELIEEITPENTKIVGGDFFEDIAKDLAKSPKKLKDYIKTANEVYRQTGDVYVLKAALRVLSIIKGNLKQQAKKADMQRSTLYRMFTKNANPTLANFAKYTYSSGIYLQLSL